jgi:hypothetical protein
LPLFASKPVETLFKLRKSRASSTGVVELTYEIDSAASDADAAQIE